MEVKVCVCCVMDNVFNIPSNNDTYRSPIVYLLLIIRRALCHP